jgi:hypothetical protein
MDDQLHAAGFVKKTLKDKGLECRQAAERSIGYEKIIHRLSQSIPWQVEAGAQILDGDFYDGRVLTGFKNVHEFASKPRNGKREFMASAGRLTKPEGYAGWLVMGVLDAEVALIETKDPPARVAQLEDVTGHAFDREIFIDGPDEFPLWFEDYAVISVIRNGAATGDRSESGAFSRAQFLVDPIPVKVGCPLAAGCGVA